MDPNSMAFVKFQVKSSGQWLNIYGLNAPSGTKACQGELPFTDNFSWEIINSAVTGWYLIQSKDTRQYLNIQNGGNNNGIACQDPLPNPSAPPDNFLWQIEAPDSNGWSLIKVKSSGQYLNVLNNGMGNGDPVYQGNPPTTPNFFWMQSTAKNPKPVTVTMTIKNCSSIYDLPPNRPDGTTLLSETQANLWLQMGDDQGGRFENLNQSSFESILNPGSEVTWSVQKDPGNANSGYTVAITNIIYEQGFGNNVLGTVTPGNSGNVKAQVIWTAIRPDNGDNEAYTIEFTLKKGNDQPKKYTFDPKIRVDPNT